MAREEYALESIRHDLEKIVEQNWPNCQNETVLTASRQMDDAICSYYMSAKETKKGVL